MKQGEIEENGLYTNGQTTRRVVSTKYNHWGHNNPSHYGKVIVAWEQVNREGIGHKNGICSLKAFARWAREKV